MTPNGYRRAGWVEWEMMSESCTQEGIFKQPHTQSCSNIFCTREPRCHLADQDYCLLESCLDLILGVKVLFDRLKPLAAGLC